MDPEIFLNRTISKRRTSEQNFLTQRGTEKYSRFYPIAEPSPAILVEVKKIRIDLSPEEKYDRGACVETK